MTKPIGTIETRDFGPLGFASLTQPIMWRMKAESLRRAAEVVWAQVVADSTKLLAEVKDGRLPDDVVLQQPPSISEQFALLAAFAIENLLKGAIIGLRAEIEPTSKISGELTSHDLVQLAERAKLTLSDDERVLLTLLTEILLVSGRYPVPKHSKDVVANRYMDYNRIHEQFGLLFDRVRAIVEATPNVPKALAPDGSPRAS